MQQRDELGEELWQNLMQEFRRQVQQYPPDPAFMDELSRIIPNEDARNGWLCSNNSWLGLRTPLEAWRDEPEAVLEAARRAVRLDF